MHRDVPYTLNHGNYYCYYRGDNSNVPQFDSNKINTIIMHD